MNKFYFVNTSYLLTCLPAIEDPQTPPFALSLGGITDPPPPQPLHAPTPEGVYEKKR